MVKLIPVSYRNKKYPYGIIPKVVEVPAHFDSVVKINASRYSLHTEYAYGPRKFKNFICKKLNGLKITDKKGVPKLWFNKVWVEDFVSFIFEIVKIAIYPPEIIEIHPPFRDYCGDLFYFVELYQIFEEKVLSFYPKVKILLENRYGTQYSRGEFVFSTINDLKKLIDLIEKYNLKLRVALDIPQLFSAHHLEIGKFSKSKLEEIFKDLFDLRDYVESIHLWGKCYGKNGQISSHMGTLDSYFYGLYCKNLVYNTNQKLSIEGNLKAYFLEELYNLLNDGKIRYFVPEVNSKEEHLQMIIKDLVSFGFRFV